MLELECGGNVRLEEGQAGDVWLVTQEICSVLMMECYLLVCQTGFQLSSMFVLNYFTFHHVLLCLLNI